MVGLQRTFISILRFIWQRTHCCLALNLHWFVAARAWVGIIMQRMNLGQAKSRLD